VATTAPRPPGVPAERFGPRLTATVAVCTGIYHLSKRTTVGLLADLFGADPALGSVTACEQAASAAVAGPVAEAGRYVQQQPVVHVAWLSVAATTLVTVFLVHVRRGTVAARACAGSDWGDAGDGPLERGSRAGSSAGSICGESSTRARG
jgi:hypothetical protein